MDKKQPEKFLLSTDEHKKAELEKAFDLCATLINGVIDNYRLCCNEFDIPAPKNGRLFNVLTDAETFWHEAVKHFNSEKKWMGEVTVKGFKTLHEQPIYGAAYFDSVRKFNYHYAAIRPMLPCFSLMNWDVVADFEKKRSIIEGKCNKYIETEEQKEIYEAVKELQAINAKLASILGASLETTFSKVNTVGFGLLNGDNTINEDALLSRIVRIF